MQKTIPFGVIILSVFMISCAPNPKKMEEASIHFQASKNLYMKGESIQSLVEAEKAQSLDSRNEEVQNFLGLLYAERTDLNKSKDHFYRAIKLKPDYSEARNNLCAFLIQDNKLDEAIIHCQKAIENVSYVTPERAYSNLGLIFLKKGDSTKSEEMHRKALLHNKKFVNSLLFLGKQAFNRNDFVKAKEYLVAADEACQASPVGAWGSSCSESQYHLALTYLKSQQTQPALISFQRCVQNDLGHEFKQKCQSNLNLYGTSP